MLKVNFKPAGAKVAYAMPDAPKDNAPSKAAAAPAAATPVAAAPAAVAAPREMETPAAAEEALLEDHVAADVDESKDVVHFAKAVNAGPPVALLAGGAAAVLALVAGLVLGGKAPPVKAAPPPAPLAKKK
jgi:hypothetical protein